jgi:hypothetical protein
MRRVHEFEFHHNPRRRPLNINIDQAGPPAADSAKLASTFRVMS